MEVQTTKRRANWARWYRECVDKSVNEFGCNAIVQIKNDVVEAAHWVTKQRSCGISTLECFWYNSLIIIHLTAIQVLKTEYHVFNWYYHQRNDIFLAWEKVRHNSETNRK